jgi:RimJ/RimL family protein N-acetyltransferase
VEYGIQRRSIYLVPPTPEDLEWMFERFDDEEVWTTFGFKEPGRAYMRAKHAEGGLVVGIIRRSMDEARIGFVVVFPPSPPFFTWELGFAIPDRRHRDAYGAIHAADAMTHYMFDHLRIESGMWRIRDDNRASHALMQRLGYRPYGLWDVNGAFFSFFKIDRELWAKRLEQLDRGEDAHPSGLGDTFITLAGPPPFKPTRY